MQNRFGKFDYWLAGFLVGSLFLNLPNEVYTFFIGVILGRITWVAKTYFNLD